MIALDTIPYNILRGSGLDEEGISALFHIVERAGGVEAARENGLTRGGACAALMELERRIGGEIVDDRGVMAGRLIKEKTRSDHDAPAPVIHRDSVLYRARTCLAEGVMLHGDSLILHGPYARALPNGVLASRAGRPVTDTIDHPALRGLVFAGRWETRPEATVIDIEQGTISLPTAGAVACIRAAFRSIGYIRPLIRETRGKKALMGQHASLVITTITMAVLLAGQANLFAVGFIALTFLAILRDTVFPTRGDMQAFLRTTREKFPKV